MVYLLSIWDLIFNFCGITKIAHFRCITNGRDESITLYRHIRSHVDFFDFVFYM